MEDTASMCDGIEPSHSLAANTVDFSTMSCTYSAGSPNIVCAVPLAYCFQTAMSTIQFSNKLDLLFSYNCVIVVSPIPVIIWSGTLDFHQKLRLHNAKNMICCASLKPQTGIEPVFFDWESNVLPLNYCGKGKR